MGFKAVRNLIISVSIIEAFSDRKTLAGFDIRNFWNHSIAVAMVSKNFGEQLHYQPPDECFVAGLLHDIGKVVLLKYFQDLFRKIWTSVSDGCISFYEAEKKEMSVDHAKIGGHLAEKWQLPIGLADTIKYHHTKNKSVTNQKLLTIVHTANIIVNTFTGNPDGKLDLSSFHPDAKKLLNPQIESVGEWFPEVSMDIESACAFFIIAYFV